MQSVVLINQVLSKKLSQLQIGATGYIFGEVLEKALGDTVEGLMIGLVVLLIIVFGGHYLVKKWQERKKV